MPDDTPNARRRGRQRAMPPPLAFTVPVPKPLQVAAQPESVAPAPSKAELAEMRIGDITRDAIEAYNRILAKPNGLLPKVMRVGFEKRKADAKRCMPVASDICRELYGDKRIVPLFWEQYFTECSHDDFTAGRKAPDEDHSGWTPDFEYLTRPKTMLRIFEKAMSK